MHWIWSLVSALSFRQIRLRGPQTNRRIYITFDDGPHPQHTPALLDLLKRYNAKATFFAIGREAKLHPQVVRRILAEGHTLGNHSMTHARLPRLAPPQQLAEIRQADEILKAISGRAMHPFRPPNGRATVTVMANSIFRRRPLVLWSIDSLDYTLSAAAVVERLHKKPLRAGDILLFHDDGQVALEALSVLLPQWIAQHLTLAAI